MAAGPFFGIDPYIECLATQPHQPSSSLLTYYIDHDHSVSSNPRLVDPIYVYVYYIVSRCNLFDCIPHPSDNRVEGSEV